MRSLIAFLCVSYFLLFAESALSQAISPQEKDADEINRQQERLRSLRQQQELKPDVRLETPQPQKSTTLLTTNESPCFTIQHIALIGELSDHFQWLLAATDISENGSLDTAAGKCLGAQGINEVMRRMQNALVAKGYITSRVLAASQDLGKGELNLTLLPGRIRDIRFTADSPTRATAWNAVPVQRGDVLNIKDVEQALENFKRIPTAEADIQITPSIAQNAQPGDSDMVIQWKQRMPFRLNLSVDNSGTKSTGKYLGTLTFSYDHWLTLNDLFYISANHNLGRRSDEGGTQGQTVHYSVPFNYWLLGFTASSNAYRQTVAGLNQNYVYSGESKNQEVSLSRLVFRNAVRKTTLSFAGWLRESHNYIDDTQIMPQEQRVAGWDIGISERDFIGQSTLDLKANWRQGTGAFRALPAPGEASGEASSRPQILTLGSQFNTPFAMGTQKLRYQMNARAQWTESPLLPQDRFSIGSRYTVRGFDEERSLAANRGWVLHNEISWVAGQTAQELYLGIDAGAVSGVGSNLLLGRKLSGMAIGLRGGLANTAYDLFVGRPLYKPSGFQTSAYVLGFNLNLSY